MTRALMTSLLLPALVLCLTGCVPAQPVDKTVVRESPTLRDLAWAFSDLEGAAARAAAGEQAEKAPSARIESPYGYRASQAGRATRDVLGALPELPTPFSGKNQLYSPETSQGRKPELTYDPRTVAVPARPEMSDVEELLSRKVKAASETEEATEAEAAKAAEAANAAPTETPAAAPAEGKDDAADEGEGIR